MKNPPRLAKRFLKWFVAPHLLEVIEGDLEEEFSFQLKSVGARKARLRYWFEVLGFFRLRYIKRKASPDFYNPLFSQSMFKNYFKVAIRQLLKNKSLSFINILGLSLGMAFALLIGMWVRFEISFDGFNQHADRIALVMKHSLMNNEKNTSGSVMMPVYDELRGNYPEIEQVSRLDWGSVHSLVAGDRKFKKEGYYVDPSFLKIFTYPIIKGNPETALTDPNSIVLTQSLSKAIFGNTDPIGKVIRIDNKFDIQVTAVIQDVPANSSLQFEFLAPFEFNVANIPDVRESKTRWNNSFIGVVLQMKEGVNLDALSKKIGPMLKNKDPFIKTQMLSLYPMKRWHLYDDFQEWVNTGGQVIYVRLFGIIGAFVLLIACINFMNLSTARFEKRAKEVGIRKAVGSQRWQLVAQFLTESMLTAFLAFILSLSIMWLLLPHLGELGFKNIKLDFTDLSLWGTVLGVCLLTGLLAGSYPAAYLSSFVPVKVLKGKLQQGNAPVNFRKVLVVSQFFISIALIIASVIVYQQVNFAKSRSIGYNPNNLITLDASSDLIKNYNALKYDLLKTGHIEAVAKASSSMTWINNDFTHFSWEGKDPGNNVSINVVMTDWDYEKTTGLEFIAGRSFDKRYSTDSAAVILNEAALKLINYEDPIGKTMKLGDQVLTIIGVTKNVLMQNPFGAVKPGVILFNGNNVNALLIRLKDQQNLSKALAAIQPIVDKYNPSVPFEYHFADQAFEQKFTLANQMARLAGIFASLSIFISCLGLFGLAMFMAERRTKEITIRKILGATVTNLWLLLSGEFIWLVGIACILAAPVTLWAMNKWLQTYEYRIAIQWWLLPATFITALAIAFATVSFQAIKAAYINPSQTLRSE
ncbi:ABC transporter permease [Dyadobacter chenwenxiniae]|uniref:ABC transporter permease n=1 Tax=Dyadobacter chenwenxiniae TaxID=2906456 RepID=A0A9X1PNN3_9BACT|nr:ABC transporter permease [Dyadobacter chenwenxiniae]MCF0064096.1 ABC transporter permease [Dyadobacter chenwenxiniae]UON82823.1 ABC transporter permease [Dyadobacter chenwenxiniae]